MATTDGYDTDIAELKRGVTLLDNTHGEIRGHLKYLNGVVDSIENRWEGLGKQEFKKLNERLDLEITQLNDALDVISEQLHNVAERMGIQEDNTAHSYSNVGKRLA